MGRKPGTPTVYLRADSGVYWCAFTVNGVRYRLSTGCTNESEAHQAAARLHAQVALGRSVKRYRPPLPGSDQPLDLLFAEFAEWYRASGRAESYVVKMESHFRAHFWPRWRALSAITVEALEHYKVERQDEDVSSVTVYKELVTMSRFLRWCHRVRRLIDHVPQVERPTQVSDYTPPTLTEREVRKLLRKLPTARTHPRRMPVREFFTFQWAQGMRPGEVRSLRWRDVDLEHRTVTIRQSEDKARHAGGRSIALHDEAGAVLRAIRPRTPHGEALIFGRCEFKESLKNAAKAAGLPHITPHHLRRARLTELASSTRDTAAVQALAGHKSLATTDRYVQSRVERMHAVFDSVTLGKIRDKKKRRRKRRKAA